MKRVAIVFCVLAALIGLVVLAIQRQRTVPGTRSAATTSSAVEPAPTPAPTPVAPPAATETRPGSETDEGFLHGRITTVDGATYEGRLRWGGDEEAFWGDHFNGAKKGNSWASHVPPERLPKELRPLEFLGILIAQQEQTIELDRQFLVRFGDIARIEASGPDARVTLKSGQVIDLDRSSANDFDDELRVWDGKGSVVDLKSRQVSTIELFLTPSPSAAPYRLYGTVRTTQGEFTGFVQWDRQECVGPDELDGHTAEGDRSVRFDTVRSIARHSADGSLVTLLDDSEVVLSGTNDVDHTNRGIYVDDPRYGRVLISWDAFERVDFTPGGSGPAYGDFPPGQPLTGTVTTRAGGRFTGRLVYDLDESETIETLDAPSGGVDYIILFGLIASIVPAGREGSGTQHSTVVLHGGEELQLEHSGDLRDNNAGILIFGDGGARPEYVLWTDVARLDFDRPPAMYPPPGGR